MITKEFLEQREKLIKRVVEACNDISVAYVKVGVLIGKEKEALKNVNTLVYEYAKAISDLIQFYDNELGLIKEDTKTREHAN